MADGEMSWREIEQAAAEASASLDSAPIQQLYALSANQLIKAEDSGSWLDHAVAWELERAAERQLERL